MSLIPTLDEIRAAADERLVTVRGSDYVVVNYTPKTQFNGVWNDTTRRCRGLILRVNPPWPESTEILEVAALPWAKFFNVGEMNAWPSEPVEEITEKLDGSLGILWRDAEGQKRVATRGSLIGPQAQVATELLGRYDLAALPENLTLLFEVLYPENRVVVDYGGRRELVLLGVRDRFTGEDWRYEAIRELGERFGLPVVPHAAEVADLDHALQLRFGLDANHEGWVLRCADGQRWKVKGEVYRQIHKLLSQLSERAVLDAILAGTADDLIAATPPEWQPTVIAWRNRIEAEAAERLATLAEVFARAPRDTRKDFALFVTKQWKPQASYLFALLDGKDPRLMLLRDLRESLSAVPLIEPDIG